MIKYMKSKMKSKNLLINIQSYAPRVGRNPKEDFFTEVFAHLIDQNRELLKEFLGLIREGLDDERKDQLSDSLLDVDECKRYKLESQIPCSDKRIDLEIKCESKNFCLFIENKLDDKVRAGQLEDYLEIWKNKQLHPKLTNGKSGNGGVVLITKKNQQKLSDSIKNDSQFLCHLRWGMVHERFKKYCDKKYNIKTKNIGGYQEYLLKQFLVFMEVQGMESIKIKEEDGGNIVRTFKILKWINGLLSEIKEGIEYRYAIKSVLKRDFGESRYEYKYFPFESSNLRYDLQFDMNINGRELAPTLYILYSGNKKGISKKKNRKLIEESLRDGRVWNNNPFKLNDSDFSNTWFYRSFEMNNEFYKKDANQQKQEIIDFFITTLDKLADEGLVKRR